MTVLLVTSAASKSSPGGTTDQSCGASAPRRSTDEVTLISTIPASLKHSHSWLRSSIFRWEPSVRVCLCLSYCFEVVVAGLQTRSFIEASENRTRGLPDSSPGRSTDVTRTFTTPETLCRGNPRSERHLALPFELQQLAPLAGFEPATAGRSSSRLHHSANPCGGNRRPGTYCLSDALPLSYSDFRRRQGSNLRPSDYRCNPSLHHAANFSIFFVPSLLRYVFTSLPRTPVASCSHG